MFDISWSEMLLIAAVSVVVIGPKDLPRALHTAGKLIRKIKTVSGDIQKSLDKIMQESELEEITRAANRAGGDNVQMMVERQLAKERAPAAKPATIDATAEPLPATPALAGDEDLRYDLDEEGAGEDGHDDIDAEEFIPGVPLQKKDSDDDANA